MNKAIKYRLYPTTKQSMMFIKTFGCCRKVFNLMLADKIAHYRQTGTMLQVTPAMYKKDYPFLKEVDSLALANAQLNLQTSYANFFDNPKSGFPKFKSAKHSRKSYTTNNQKGTISIQGDSIRLPKIGFVKAKIHRQPDADWKLKSATISQDGDGHFYVSVLFEYNRIIVPVSKTSDNAIGLDYKSDGLYTDSNGNCADMPKYYRQSQNRLAHAQRKLKHKTVGSNNYYKQQRKIAKIHKHVSNQRKDYLHKLSAGIANRYDIVCVEDLDMKALSNHGFGNGKATLDNGNGMFLSMLGYKLADRGKYLVKIYRYYPSSQTCSGCGRIHPKMKNLNIRTMHCECGNIMDRDENAAVNIKNEGLRILRTAA